jgi:hypothetical protein
MTNTENFLLKLTGIEEDLRKLCVEYSDLYEEYNGTDFPDQETLVGVKLDNLILAATDEICSQINFNKKSIIDLIKFIGFRKKYKQFSDEELEKAIDNDNFLLDFKLYFDNLNLTEKKVFIKSLKDLRSEWNKLFQNRFYCKLRESFQK